MAYVGIAAAELLLSVRICMSENPSQVDPSSRD